MRAGYMTKTTYSLGIVCQGAGVANWTSATVQLQGKPNDPSLGMQWGLREAGLGIREDISQTSDAWDIEVGLRDVIICTIDSGIEAIHPDLHANLWVNVHETPGNGIDDDNNGVLCTLLLTLHSQAEAMSMT
jgi:subtilisin family serine protease